MAVKIHPSARFDVPAATGDALYLVLVTLLFMVTFALERSGLLIANIDLAGDIPRSVLTKSFLVGARFDLLVAAYVMLPLVLVYALPGIFARRTLSIAWVSLCGAVFLFLGLIEPEYYSQFHARLDSVAVQYLKEDPKTVMSMLWNGFPMMRYLLLWATLTAVFVYAVRWLAVATTSRKIARATPAQNGVRLLIFTGLFLVFGIAARGGWQHGPPLRWGDAYQSPYLFANQLALNGGFTLAHAVLNAKRADRDRLWLHTEDDGKALATVQNLLAQPGDRFEASVQYPILRTHQPGAMSKHVAPQIRNVIVIIMESFSAQFVGALGATAGVTPEFDKLASEGVLFDHFFSNGTHTHQGMFATLGCFPNLPNHEYLMQQPEGRHAFSGFATLLSRRGYQTLYVYNGSFSWDNQEGFFRNQGIKRFIGRDDFVNPKLTSSTWGVADEDMFNRATDELDKLPGGKPFFAVLQTLSNHTPFTFPSDMPFPHYTDRGDLNERFTAFRYSDWALGQFFRRARHSPYYHDTLFVIVGDHGFGVPRQLGRIDLLRFHVPMLLIAPGLRETFGARRSTVASQVDIVPTAMALLGQPFQHQCWGRDVLALEQNDPGFAVLKPSGSSQLVALVKGQTLLTKSIGQNDQILHYRLYPEPSVIATPESQLELEQAQIRPELNAYVQAALSGLLNNRTGLPDQPVGTRTAQR